MSADDWTDPALPELIARAFELLDAGETVDAEALCAERPDLLEALRAALDTRAALPGLHRANSTHDRLNGLLLADRYRLLERLGSGAMGVVYRALDEQLKRDVAIKLLRPALIEGPDNRRRFVREGQTLAAIRHPGVVTIFDRGETEEADPFLVIELLEGRTLVEIVEEGEERFGTAVPDTTDWIAASLGAESVGEASYVRAVARWGAELAAGLEAAHAKNILHRDVKPSNIFLRVDGRPALLDFGVAGYISQESLSHEGSPLGTPAYMAPESLGETPQLTPALDVYGLCSTLYHLLTFRPPYVGTFSMVLSALATREPAPLRRLRPDLPRDLVAIIEHGMERRPRDRYASARALREDLLSFLAHRPVSVRPLTRVARGLRRVRRSRAWLSGSVVALLFLAGWGLSAGSAYRDEVRAGHRFEAWRRLPPNLTIATKPTRVIEDPALRAHVGELLDAAVANADEPIPARLWRSAFRLDHGDPAGAAADFREVADELGGEYLARLAERYDALPPGASGIDALDLSELPEAHEPLDLFVAAYHVWRLDDREAAWPMFEDPALDGYAPAASLRVLHLASAPTELYEGALEVERLEGGRSAMSAYLVGLGLFVQGRHREAVEVFRQGLELSPESHVLDYHAGFSLWRLGRLEESRLHAARAVESKPDWKQAHEGLIRTLLSAERFDEARARILAAPLGDGAEGERARAVHLGELEAHRAFSRLGQGDADAARDAAERSLSHYQRAAELGLEVDNYRSQLSRAIVAGEARPLFRSILGLVRDQPPTPRRLEILLSEFPDELDAEETALLKKYFEKRRRELAANQ